MEAGVIHLLEASIKLRCSLEVTAKSLLLYHHFRRCGAEILFDEDIIAAKALDIGARFYEQAIDMDSLICVFYSIVNQTTDVMVSDDRVYLVIKETLIKLDLLMFRVFEFDMTHRLAHEYLVPFVAMIFERSKNIADFHGELGRTCMRFLSDFYTQQICLEFSPELIAIACIDLSLQVHGLINDLTMIPAWYMGFICGITPDKVRVIRRIIMSLYEKPIAAIHTQQYLPTLEEQVTSSAEQATLAAQKGTAPGLFGQFAVMQQSLQAQEQQVLRPPEQYVLQAPGQQILQHPVQQVLPPTIQQGLLPPVQQGLQPLVQQGLRPPVHQGLRPPVQRGLRPSVQQGLRPPTQQGLRPPVQQGLRPPVQRGLRLPVQQSLRPPVQQALQPPAQHILQAPVQQVPGTQFVPAAIQKLLSTPNFLPTNLQQVESMDIPDSSAQKN